MLGVFFLDTCYSRVENSLFFVLRELKDNLGNDEPEGDMPVLLQALLSRNPKIFRDKSMSVQGKGFCLLP